MHFALLCDTQWAWHYALNFIIQKTNILLFTFIYVPNYKRTYDQSDQIENKLEIFIENWSYSYEQ